MRVLASITATDQGCGNCLQDVAMAAATDPSKLLPCADSTAVPRLQSMFGFVSGGQSMGAAAVGAIGSALPKPAPGMQSGMNTAQQSSMPRPIMIQPTMAQSGQMMIQPTMAQSGPTMIQPTMAQSGQIMIQPTMAQSGPTRIQPRLPQSGSSGPATLPPGGINGGQSPTVFLQSGMPTSGNPILLQATIAS